MGQSPPFIGLFIGQRQTSTRGVGRQKVGQLVIFWVCLWTVPHAVGRVAGSYWADLLGRSVSNSGAVGSGRRGRGRVGRSVGLLIR